MCLPPLQFPLFDVGPRACDGAGAALRESGCVLSGYTSKGILTINEARVALGLAPLTDASANRPMTLTNAGFVALPE